MPSVVSRVTLTNGAEIVAYDAARKKFYVTGGQFLAVVDATNAANLTISAELDLGRDIQSAAVSGDILAVARSGITPQDPGEVLLWDLTAGPVTATPTRTLAVGALPDNVVFSPDGTKILTANEGEPNDDYTNDPEGSISVINVSGGVAAATVATANFAAFVGQEATLRAQGIRIFGPGATAAQDFEPEYIAVSPDSNNTAYVTLQENNALAIVDITNVAAPIVTAVVPLGFKDHSLPQNSLDPSNQDAGIRFGTFPNLFGMYQPDTIAAYKAGGQTYLVTANEGDARDYKAFSEEARISSLTLDPTAFPNAAALKANDQLGRLLVTNTLGDTGADGDFDQLYAYGARSFSIWDAAGNLVFDSGNQLARILAGQVPEIFNANNSSSNDFDARSDDKGIEPEAITVGTIGNKTYAFVGFERPGGVATFDITDPNNVGFVNYFTPNLANLANPVDSSPEGFKFITAGENSTGKEILAVANELSNTLALYTDLNTFTLQLLHASDLEGGVDAIDKAPNFAAVVEALEFLNPNTLILSAGDNYLPGPFFSAAGDQAAFRDSGLFNDIYNELFGVTGYNGLRENGGRVDISIMNIIGFDASALGNHEFDLGSTEVANIIGADFRNPLGPAGDRWVGAQFPYLSANLDFSGDSALSGLFTPNIQLNTEFRTGPAESLAGTPKPKIAPATVVQVGGELIGVVGATTPLLASISSPSGTLVVGPTTNDMPALAAVLQPVIDDVINGADNTSGTADDVNKIILTTHLQQFALEQQLAGLLRGVDIIIAGGSDTLLADSQDTLRPGDTAAGDYPFLTTNADGDPIAVVSIDGEYSYVGRLVVQFDGQGRLIPSSIDPKISGAFATTDEVVNQLWEILPGDPFDAGTKGEKVKRLVDATRVVVETQDANIFGLTNVFIEGRRERVRTEETTMGNLTADANLAYAKSIDSTVLVSIKNGGGIRNPIGEVDSITGELLPPQLTRDSNGNLIKQASQVSQLDIASSLRFNNGLTLLTVTAAELKQILEHAVAATAPGATPGQFPQVGGLRFSFDPTGTAIVFDNNGNVTTNGTRIRNLAIVDEDENIIDVIAQNGQIVGNANRNIRLVTLNFLANAASGTPGLGGDRYPFPVFGENVVQLTQPGTRTGNATFADDGSEQDAFAEFFKANYSNSIFNSTEVGPEDDVRIQDITKGPDTVLQEGLFTNSNNTVFIHNTSQAFLQASIVNVNINIVNEIGVFIVDDDNGTINGVAPGSANYLQAALANAQSLISILANRPTGFEQNEQTRVVPVGPNARVRFLLTRNSTIDGAKAALSAGQTPNVLFNSDNTVDLERLGGGDFVLKWKGVGGDNDSNDGDNNDGVLEIKIETVGTLSLNPAQSPLPPIGTNLQGQNEREVLDFRTLVGRTINATFTVNREAAFNNFVGFYRVANETGGIDTNSDGIADVNPGAANYAQAAMNARVAGIDLAVANQGNATFTGQFTGGSIFAPFIITNGGTPSQVANGILAPSSNVFFPYLAANTGGVDHVRLLGTNTWGFEDITGGGDADYNDIIVQAKVSIA